MKMLVVVYSDAVDEDVVEAFKNARVEGYTKWREALGEGRESEPKLGTHFWPGKNNVLAMVVADEALPTLREIIQGLRSKHPKAGLKTFMLQVEDII
jgi:hypothetical protein